MTNWVRVRAIAYGQFNARHSGESRNAVGEFVNDVSDSFIWWLMDSGFRRSDAVVISYAIALRLDRVKVDRICLPC